MVAFFGEAPFWLPAFLLSCKANPGVTWHIFTDIQLPQKYPENVVFFRTELAALSRLCSDRLGVRIELRPEFAYKICDLRPAYGRIFSETLRGFDFWGHCDMDVVWGNIRGFISDRMLARYDVISSRTRKMSGHFSLFRNTETINSLFSRLDGVTSLMQDDEYRHVDEDVLTGHLQALCSRRARLRGLLGGASAVAPKVYWQRHLTTTGYSQRSVGESEQDSLVWRSGRTFSTDGTELMYLHFHKLKAQMRELDFAYDDDPDAFLINRRGFLRLPSAAPRRVGAP